MENSGKQLIGSLTKGLIIIETLLEQKSVGVSELGRLLSVNKSSAYRLLCTLEERDFVKKEPGGKYVLGNRLRTVSSSIPQEQELTETARPFLKELVALTKESASLCVCCDDRCVIVDRINSKETIAANVELGMQEPWHCTAHGKILLCEMSEIERKKALEDSPLPAYTPSTVTSVAQILKEADTVSRSGIAIDDEEHCLGMRCIAAPIRNQSGQTVASIGISGPVIRLRDEVMPSLIDTVKQVAQSLSRLLP